MSGPQPIQPKLLGELAVVIIKAKNLPDRSKIGKHNPYVIVQYKQEKRKSKVIKKGGQHPEFDDEVRFKIFEETEDILARPSKSSDTPSLNSSGSLSPSLNGLPAEKRRVPINKSIQIQVWADDSKEPKIVGECSVDLTEVFKTCEQDDWYELQYRDRYAGEISLELTYFINDAPPIPKKVIKPVVPTKPSIGSITSISAIATFDGPAGFPLKGTGGGRKPVYSSVTGHAYHGSLDNRYKPVGGMDELGGRVGYSGSPGQAGQGHRMSFNGRPSSVNPGGMPGYDPIYASQSQNSVDSLGGSLSSMSISSYTGGPGSGPGSILFPSATPTPSSTSFNLPTPAPPPPLSHSHGQRYSISGGIPQSSSWNGPPAGQGYQPSASDSYGTLPPLPPPPGQQIQEAQQQGYSAGYSNIMPPSTSFPQLYQPEQPPPLPPSSAGPDYVAQQANPYLQAHLSQPPAPSRTPIPINYDTGPGRNGATPTPWQGQQHPASLVPNGYNRPASTNTSGYIPPPLIDNRPPPRPTSQPLPPPAAPFSPPPLSGQGQAYGGQSVPPLGGHYPKPTNSFHYSPVTPAPTTYGDASGARPLPLPASGGYGQDPGFGQAPSVQADWRDPAFGNTGVFQDQSQPIGGYNSQYPPPMPPSLQPQQGYDVTSYGRQEPPQQMYQPYNSYQGGLEVPPPPPPRPHSPPAPVNSLTSGFAGRVTGRSYLSNLGVADGSSGGSYGLPPRLPDSLLQTGQGGY